MEQLLQTIEQIIQKNPYKIQINMPRQKNSPCQKAALVPLAGGWQLQKYTATQVFHHNVTAGELPTTLAQMLQQEFFQLQAFTQTEVHGLRVTKKGALLQNRTAAPQKNKTAHQPTGHNRTKNYLLPEGTVVPALVDMGVFTPDGRVVKAMYDKYRQINRFVELVDNALKEAPTAPLHIVDFGCGKSYLTFVLYYYFTQIRGLPVQMTGLDLKKDVVEKCNTTAQKYGYNNLHFAVGDINGYTPAGKIDMVISLHACDTATDYALANAVQWGAKYIFSVPCCQHQLNAQIQSDSFAALTRYGIVKERVAALMTDAIRANLLQACGYKTQLVEFVGFEHTPKNILIRAVKSNVPLAHRRKVLQEVQSLMEEFSLEPILFELLQAELNVIEGE
ncbi:SAM-dependent methyltransferase [Ruminococcaceae bacterium OttesenSCG-928-A16]|nr:SAM-dependent methyltransferase [Ruminococcaceae bacterium OttesenSCG-928-A16]